jgi:large subunit ribosomal protein L4
VKSLAFRTALSERLLAGDVVVVSDLKLEGHKTKPFVAALSKIAPKAKTTLVVTDAVDKNLKLASRNLPTVQVEPADSVNCYELLRFDKIVTTKAALDKIKARISKS